MGADKLKLKVFEAVTTLVDSPKVKIEGSTPLLGDGSVLDSMKLVELCLLLEDIAATMGFMFDWTSKAALSKSQSMFRTVDTLAAEFSSQGSAKK